MILINHGQEAFYIEERIRIAQLVIQYVPQVTLQEVDELMSSERGKQGVGSSGTK